MRQALHVTTACPYHPLRHRDELVSKLKFHSKDIPIRSFSKSQKSSPLSTTTRRMPAQQTPQSISSMYIAHQANPFQRGMRASQPHPRSSSNPTQIKHVLNTDPRLNNVRRELVLILARMKESETMCRDLNMMAKLLQEGLL
ncbi:hypothetical protein PROFUN_08274 [Planoprotostelium fungivorum]|uniref:Uncharacterized protein n=1 Tax=Planoprotostelium fungivorum TaxID=1890364 RepID=A0A2P6NJY4_9EUKA|nr:hypothetical protein PROFUN_08274 [Planoprotostelium fungivorum]